MTDKPRQYTTEEVKTQFIDMVRAHVGYWSDPKVAPERDLRGRLEGLAFSILVTLDGDSAMPGFIVAPHVHDGDKQDAIDDGENWYPEPKDVERDAGEYDIAGSLHDSFYKAKP